MKEESSLFFLDTNILIYAYEKENTMKKKKAEELISKCWEGKISLGISNQILSEFAFVIFKKAKLDLSQAKINISDIINFDGFKKIDYNIKTILLAIAITKEFHTPFWDSLIAATMKENGIFNIYTENTKDFNMPWINAINPMTSSSN